MGRSFEDRVGDRAGRDVGRSLGTAVGGLIEGGGTRARDALGLETERERRERIREERREDRAILREELRRERMEERQHGGEGHHAGRGRGRHQPEGGDVRVTQVSEPVTAPTGGPPKPETAAPAQPGQVNPASPSVHGLSGNPLENSLRLVMAKSENALTSTMTPEQKALFNNYQIASAPYPKYDAHGKLNDYSGVDPAVIQKARDQERAVESVLRNNLSPEQRVLFDKYKNDANNALNWPDYKAGQAAPAVAPAVAPVAAPTQPAPAKPADTKPVDLAAQQKQAYLKILGYEAGALDGNQGPKTNAALDKFAKDNGIDPKDTNAVNKALLEKAQDPKTKNEFLGKMQEKIAAGKATPDEIKALQWEMVGDKDPEGTMPKSYNDKTKTMDGVAKGETKETLKSTFARTAQADEATTQRVAALEQGAIPPATLALQEATPAIAKVDPNRPAANRDSVRMEA